MSEPTYKNLKSYQQAVAICDLTVEFCNLYFSYKPDKSDKTYRTNMSYRTYDQMVQAARSGKQNIVEGCAASKHNPETEIKLLGVARASFEELLEDYNDFLRQRKMPVWDKDDPKTLALRKTDKTYRSYMTYMSYPEKIGNAMITLINQTNYLLDRQIKGVKKANDSLGVIWEGLNQRASRIQREESEKEKKFDEWLEAEREKLKNKPI